MATFKCHRPGCVITDPHVCPVYDPAEHRPRNPRTYPPQWPQPGAAPLTAPESTPGSPAAPGDPGVPDAAHRSDVEAIATIGQHTPQPDGNGGKAIRRGPIPPVSLVGYTLHYTISGISISCDRCQQETDVEDHALIAVVRDAMLHSERCTG